MTTPRLTLPVQTDVQRRLVALAKKLKAARDAKRLSDWQKATLAAQPVAVPQPVGPFGPTAALTERVSPFAQRLTKAIPAGAAAPFKETAGVVTGFAGQAGAVLKERAAGLTGHQDRLKRERNQLIEQSQRVVGPERDALLRRVDELDRELAGQPFIPKNIPQAIGAGAAQMFGLGTEPADPFTASLIAATGGAAGIGMGVKTGWASAQLAKQAAGKVLRAGTEWQAPVVREAGRAVMRGVKMPAMVTQAAVPAGGKVPGMVAGAVEPSPLRRWMALDEAGKVKADLLEKEGGTYLFLPRTGNSQVYKTEKGALTALARRGKVIEKTPVAPAGEVPPGAARPAPVRAVPSPASVSARMTAAQKLELPSNSDGTVTLFHGTNRASGLAIRKSGHLIGKEDGVFLTTDKDAARTFGEDIVEVRVDPRQLLLDDEFPSGRKDFRIPARIGEAVPVQAAREAVTLEPAPVRPSAVVQPPAAPTEAAAVTVARPQAVPGGAKPDIPPTVPSGPPPASPGAETQQVASLASKGEGKLSVADDWKEFAQASDPAGSTGGVPPRGRKPPVRGAGPPSPKPDDVFAQVTAQATRGEPVSETLLRRHSGTITAAENEARVILDEGSQRLRALGVGQIYRGRLISRERDIPVLDQLYEALHNPSKVASGEVKIPAGLETEYARLRELTNWEEAARIDFDPAMATVEDYFYRGWLWPKGAVTRVPTAPARGRLGVVPSFKKPRVDATFREMREAGFEPLSWNPYEQWRISRLQGERYRQQMQLIDHLKKLELAHTNASKVGVAGWRTPRVGPAFEGKIFATTDAAGEPVAMYSRRWVVPDDLASRLENIYGVTPDLGAIHVGNRSINLMKAIDAVVFIPKRVKLFGSLFQQIDFLTRNYVGAWSGMVDALAAGQPITAVRRLAVWPRSAYQIIEANVRPGARAAIRRQLNSTTPLIPGRPGIHLRGIVEAGLSTIDTTLLPANLDATARVVAGEAGLLGNRAVRRALGSLESTMRRGLFEGTYPAAQITDIKNNIAPMLVRRYGSLSDEALNGMIARVVNKKYSTIPAAQSVVQNRAFREILRRLLFSMGESEGLLRQATGAIRGPEAGYWRTHWIGAYLGLIALANAIHFASTGQPLPWSRWTPLSKDKWGPLPIGYNQEFAAPDIPLKGAEGRNMTVDLVGQLDTAFRILDPVSFLSARESVPIRTAMTQMTERDYFGRPIDQVGPGGIFSRTANLINDMFAPIGIGQAAGQIALEQGRVPEKLIPASERGLSTAGRLIQATGINLRAQYLRSLWEPDLAAFNAIPTDKIERQAKLNAAKTPEERAKYEVSRADYRNMNPDVDAKLFITGTVSSLYPAGAVEAVRLIKERGIKWQDISGVKSRMEALAKAKKAGIGLLPSPVDHVIQSLAETPSATAAPTKTQKQRALEILRRLKEKQGATP